MRPPAKPWGSIWLWLAVALTGAKLWLTLGQPVYAIGPAVHDDALFLKLARSLVRGEWLGAYDQFTLAKGPFYPLFIAFVFWVGVPLALAQHLFYAGACATFARAVRPAIHSAGASCGLYALLLLNPMSWEGPTNGRILRQAVYTPLGVMIFAALVALYCRRAEPLRRQAPWASLLGLALGCFWLTREESIWIVPSVLMLAGGYCLAAARTSRAALRRSGAALAIAAVCTTLPLLAVATMNLRHYGWFGTVEVTSAPLERAYGALLRIKVGPELPFVPVTRAAREAAYEVSPTLARLRPHLEGSYGRGWAGASVAATGRPPDELEIAGGWFLWALRDCAAAAGEAPDAARALAFYQRLADEINAACDDGRLPARPPRSGFFPPWRDAYAGELVRTLAFFADFFLTYQAFSAFPNPSLGDEGELQVFRDLTRSRIARKAAGENLEVPTQDWLDRIKLDSLHRAGHALRGVFITLMISAQALFALRLLQLARARSCSFPFAAAVAAWGGICGYLLLNALVQVTSFSLIAVSSFSPIYPWAGIFIAMVAWDAWSAWRPATAPKIA